MDKKSKVVVFEENTYDISKIYKPISGFIKSCNKIKKGNTVIIKPNWVKEAHLNRSEDWDYVVTHPNVIYATLKAVLENLQGEGKVIIADGPQTDSSFSKIMKLMNTSSLYKIGNQYGIPIEIIDLREEEWVNRGDITVLKKKLKGDPNGSTTVNLKSELSEFFKHVKSKRGYYGADYDLKETNRAHDGENNLYKVSKTAIEADVFINLPKLKTHKKAGLTSCLKNLVGINTHKNYLPHHSEGSFEEGGDQFIGSSLKTRVEGSLMASLKQTLLQNQTISPLFIPIKKMGKIIFGSTDQVVRSGNWYGNDTLWRTILDLNKILFYANPDGSIKDCSPTNMKNYIGIVDGIFAGEGNGPMAPEKRHFGKLICGTSPVAIDCVCASLMGFDYLKIPVLKNAFCMNNYSFFEHTYEDIEVHINGKNYPLSQIPSDIIDKFEPHFGWKNHIELNK